MQLYIKQKVFSIGDRFSVYDADGYEKYHVEGEIFTFGKRFHIYDLSGNELFYIEEKIFTFLPKFYIFREGQQVAEIIKEFTFFNNEYTVNGPGWSVTGNFLDHDYDIKDRNGMIIASVAKEWLSWGDTYSINISDAVDEAFALAVVIVIDACLEKQKNN